MLFAFRNFKRNKMVNLSATSIKYFIPDAEIYCITFFEKTAKEYDSQEPLLPFIYERKVKTKYPNINGKPHDHPEITATSGELNPDTTKFFSEGYNEIWKLLKHREQKVLMLGEDSFFTTGKVLEELKNNEDWFSVAFGEWCCWGYEEKWANATCICFDLKELNHIFPIPEKGPDYIEAHLYHVLCKIPYNKRYVIKHRTFENYHGDGIRTNSSLKIEEELKKAGII